MPVFDFDRDIALKPDDKAEIGCWRAAVSGRWNIGKNPNGGYLTSIVLEAMTELGGRPDPLTVTTHFMRPGLSGQRAKVRSELLRPGRVGHTMSGSLHQDGKQRLEVLAALGELEPADGSNEHASLLSQPVELPPPEDCLSREGLEQGVGLPILSMLDVRIDPQWAEAGGGSRAEVSGWIRFSDGRPVDTKGLVLFADAFPPSLFSLFGPVGWIPTLELTVHVRRQPTPGWIRAQFSTEDLHNGLLIENGQLWDESGQLVAQCRQLALLL